MSDYSKQKYGRNRNGHKNQKTEIKVPGIDKEWIEDKINAGAVKYAEALGTALAKKGFTTSQFRNFYGELKRIQMKGIGDDTSISSFHLLKPKIAYATKRSGDKANLFKKHTFDLIDLVKIDEVKGDKRFNNFCDLIEAILAYHKAAGGRD